MSQRTRHDLDVFLAEPGVHLEFNAFELNCHGWRVVAEKENRQGIRLWTDMPAASRCGSGGRLMRQPGSPGKHGNRANWDPSPGMCARLMQAGHNQLIHKACAFPDFVDLMGFFGGAGDGTRTHDILLGKQTLYQLSYTRSARVRTRFICHPNTLWVLSDRLPSPLYAARREDSTHARQRRADRPSCWTIPLTPSLTLPRLAQRGRYDLQRSLLPLCADPVGAVPPLPTRRHVGWSVQDEMAESGPPPGSSRTKCS
jgi:hypothetical protein